MDQFIINIIPRPELVPEYIDRGAQSSQTEALSKDDYNLTLAKATVMLSE
jgi:hypothetical protein